MHQSSNSFGNFGGSAAHSQSLGHRSMNANSRSNPGSNFTLLSNQAGPDLLSPGPGMSMTSPGLNHSKTAVSGIKQSNLSVSQSKVGAKTGAAIKSHLLGSQSIMGSQIKVNSANSA